MPLVRPAADGKRPGRPRDRVRGGDRLGDATRPCLRRRRGRRSGGHPVRADRHAGA